MSTHVYGGVTGWPKGTITRCVYCGYAVRLVEHGYSVEDYTIEWETWTHMRHDGVCQRPKPVAATSIDRWLAEIEDWPANLHRWWKYYQTRQRARR